VTVNKSKSITTIGDAAVDFLQLVVSGRIREAYSKYVGLDFRHHNPLFRGDAGSLMVAMEEDAEANPEKILEIQRVLQDGNLVAVHSWIRQNPSDRGVALFHIFRFEGDLIAELWDITQVVPEDSPNEHGMF
jgi:predicted SnoaL-like aldol condensation-catalyzing enzyme